MEVEASKLSPAPVILRVKNWRGKIRAEMELLPFSLEVQVWADEAFATNAEGNNGLAVLTARLASYDRDAVTRIVYRLLKEPEAWGSVLDFKKKWQKSFHFIEGAYLALDEAIRKASPDVYNVPEKEPDPKKKDRAPIGLTST